MKHLTTLFSLLALVPVAPTQVAPAQIGTDTAEVRSLCEYAFQLFQPVGLAVAVIDADQVVLEIGLGERARGGGEPVTATTPFNIASCTKAFTAAAIGKLVAEGKLGWDDLVVQHVPEFRLADPWITRHLTVRDLLCHRSGLKTFEGDLLWYGSDYDDAEVLARTERLPITRRFREQFGYQNILYMVAGLIVERTSGLSWSDYVQQSFLAPLGMAGTAPGLDRLPADATPARPHIDGVEIEPVRIQACKPAAAIWSSVRDLTAWMRMLLADGQWNGSEILPSTVIHECWIPHTPMRGGRTPAAIEDFSAYGMGWFLYVHDGKKLVEHDGGMPGYISKVTLLPAERFGLVILNNGMDGLVNLALRRAILAQRKGEDGRITLDRFAQIAKIRKQAAADAEARRVSARQSGTTPSLALAGYAGRYEDAVLGPAEVRLDGESLKLVILPSARTLNGVMMHWHHDVFRVDFPDRFLPFALVSFQLDVEGKVAGFRIDCPIDDFDFAALDFRRVGG